MDNKLFCILGVGKKKNEAYKFVIQISALQVIKFYINKVDLNCFQNILLFTSCKCLVDINYQVI